MASTRRTAFILGSILIHAGLGVGVFASQVWGIERLDGTFKSSPGLAVMMPLPESGGAPKLPEVKIEKKQKQVVTETVQLTPKEDVPTKPADLPPTQTTGSGGDGSGSGSGSAGDTGTCLVDCGGGGSGSGSPPPVVKKDPPKDDLKDTIVPPNVLTMMRLTGSTQIHPTDVTKIQMQRDGRDKTIGVAKVCVSETGAVTSVTMMNSTKYPAYDAQLIAGIKTWTYKPYAAHGRNVKVCGTVTFVYGMK